MTEKTNFGGYPKDNPLFNIRGLSQMTFLTRPFPVEGYELAVKPLYPVRDIPTIHGWVNAPYALEYWQMPWSEEKLFRYYKTFLNSGAGYSLMFFIGDKPVAQINFYHVMSDEIKTFYDAKPNDYGIHVLMGRYKKPIARLSTNVVITCLYYLFSLSVDRVIGNPDSSNKRANELAQRVGFQFIKTVQMSYKEANLYRYTRVDFFNDHPSS